MTNSELAGYGALGTGIAGTAAQAIGDFGGTEVEYTRPKHAAIATGLLAEPVIKSLTTGRLPETQERQARQERFSTEAQENSKLYQQLAQIPSSSPGLRLYATQNNLAKLLTNSALDAVGRTGSAQAQYTNLAQRFAELGRNSQINQRQNFNNAKWVTLANQWLALGGSALGAYDDSDTTTDDTKDTQTTQTTQKSTTNAAADTTITQPTQKPYVYDRVKTPQTDNVGAG